MAVGAVTAFLSGVVIWQIVPALVQMVALVGGGDDAMRAVPFSGVLTGIGLGMFVLSRSQNVFESALVSLLKLMAILLVMAFTVWSPLFDWSDTIVWLMGVAEAPLASQLLQWILGVWSGFWPGVFFGVAFNLAFTGNASKIRELVFGYHAFGRASFFMGSLAGVALYLWLPASFLSFRLRNFAALGLLLLLSVLIRVIEQRWVRGKRVEFDKVEITTRPELVKASRWLVLYAGLATGAVVLLWLKIVQLFYVSVGFGVWQVVLAPFLGVALGCSLYLAGSRRRLCGPRAWIPFAGFLTPLLVMGATLESYRRFLITLGVQAQGVNLLQELGPFQATLQVTFLSALMLGIMLCSMSQQYLGVRGGVGGRRLGAFWGALTAFTGSGMGLATIIYHSSGVDQLVLFIVFLLCILSLARATTLNSENTFALGAAVVGVLGLSMFLLWRYPSGLMAETRTALAGLNARTLTFVEETSIPLTDRKGRLPLRSTLTQRQFLKQPYSRSVKVAGQEVLSDELSATYHSVLQVVAPLLVSSLPERVLQISPTSRLSTEILSSVEEVLSIDIADPLPPELLEVVEPAADLLPEFVNTYSLESRIFLTVNDSLYDLITVEPPSLYLGREVRVFSVEFFTELKGHLTPSGLVSYSINTKELPYDSFLSVTSGFCAVFEDCSLWYVNDHMLLMLGGQLRQRNGTELSSLWKRKVFSTPPVPEVVEDPSVALSNFIADASTLNRLTAEVTPVYDSVSTRDLRYKMERVDPEYLKLINEDDSRDRLLKSPSFSSLLPDTVVKRAAYYQLYRPHLDSLFLSDTLEPTPRFGFEPLSFLLTYTKLSSLPRIMLRSDQRKLEIVASMKSVAEGDKQEAVAVAFEGIEALVQRNYRQAASLFTDAIRRNSSYDFLYNYRVFALCLGYTSASQAQESNATKLQKALEVSIQVARETLPPESFNGEFWQWAELCAAR